MEEIFRVLWVVSYFTFVMSIMFSGIILMWPSKKYGGSAGVKKFWMWKFRMIWNLTSGIGIFLLNFLASVFGAEVKKKLKKKKKRKK